MTEAGMRSVYKNKPEMLDEMLKVKSMEELCSLFDDENFVEKGAGKTERFYEAIIGKSTNQNTDTESTQTSQEVGYITLHPIRHSGEYFESGVEVSEEDFGDDFERLLKVGAIGELLSPPKKYLISV